MYHTHRPYIKGQTIAALATAFGEAAIAIIRICGDRALDIVSRIFSGPIHSFASHTAHLGKIHGKDGALIDEVLVLIMLGRRSFCGEDTVEIHCHGGSFVVKRVLDAVIEAGALPAMPGEFSYKAFMNGKIDLAQAEAIQELIGAKNAIALKNAEEQLQGSLSSKIEDFQRKLFDIAAILEAWVDFPEEGLEFASKQQIIDMLSAIVYEMKMLSATFREGQILKEGVSLCLAGPPNAGKSSLMNALLGKDRAIVTDIAGTTRDILEEDLLFGGIHFRIKDTAGIRHTEEIIEKEGIRRSKEAMQNADLVFIVIDASKGLTLDDEALIAKAPTGRSIILWNKIDLPHNPPPALRVPVVGVSAKSHIGFEDLKAAVTKILFAGALPASDEVILTSARHKAALEEAIEALESLSAGLEEDISAEFLSSDMRHALKELSSIIGKDVSEEILSAIFSKFCVGK